MALETLSPDMLEPLGFLKNETFCSLNPNLGCKRSVNLTGKNFSSLNLPLVEGLPALTKLLILRYARISAFVLRPNGPPPSVGLRLQSRLLLGYSLILGVWCVMCPSVPTRRA